MLITWFLPEIKQKNTQPNRRQITTENVWLAITCYYLKTIAAKSNMTRRLTQNLFNTKLWASFQNAQLIIKFILSSTLFLTH